MDSFLNGNGNQKQKDQSVIQEPINLDYSPGFAEDTKIALKNGGYCSAQNIQLTDEISKGKVVGIIRKKVAYFIRFGEDLVSASSLIWDKKTDSWQRAWRLGKILTKEQIAYSFIVSPTATIETRQGTHIRDYMEVMSPDSESDYVKEITVLF